MRRFFHLPLDGLCAATLTLATLYGNVRPEVNYVGDEACARCHRKLARTYHQHPMGRTLVPLTGDASLEPEKALSLHNASL